MTTLAGPPLGDVGPLTIGAFALEVCTRFGANEALVFDDPLLDGTTGAFSARIVERLERGDHLLVLAEVTAIHRGDTERTLVYQNRGYARLTPFERG